MEPVFNCEHCGVTLRVKPASLKLIRSVQCSKCMKRTAIPQALIDAARDGSLNVGTEAPKPAAPVTAPPPPPPAPPPPAPPPVVIATPQPPPAPQPQAAAAGQAEVDELRRRVTDFESRLSRAELAISALRAELAANLHAEAETVRKRGDLLSKTLENLGKH